jgi:hypothetical protein
MIFLDLDKVEFRVVNYGDWHLSGWYHPDAKKYKMTGIIGQKLGEEKIKAIAFCSFSEEFIEQDIKSMEITLVPKVGTRCSVWMVKAIGDKSGIKIIKLKEASPNILAVQVEKLVDLQLAFKKFLEG